MEWYRNDDDGVMKRLIEKEWETMQWVRGVATKRSKFHITPLLMMITIVGYDELAESISECYSLLIKWSCWLTIAIHFLLLSTAAMLVN